MITRKLNPRVYDSLLVLLDAVHLYRVYRRLDTLPLYIYYELLILGYLALHNLIGTSLSEPYTRGNNGVSIAFLKIYVEIQINGTSIMCSQNFTFKNWVVT